MNFEKYSKLIQQEQRREKRRGKEGRNKNQAGRNKEGRNKNQKGRDQK